MTEEKEKILIREILVALDTSVHSRAALEAAATLARTLEATIRGLFVEDDDWYRISRLPQVSEISDLTGNIQPFAEQKLDEQIRILENRIRRDLQRISRLNKVKHSWKTTRGIVEEKVLEAAEKADLITIGIKGHSYYKQLGKTAGRIIEKSKKPVLLLREGLKLGDTIVTVFDASGDSVKSIRFALELAKKTENGLFVMIVGNNEEDVDEREETLNEFLQKSGYTAKIQILKQSNIWEFMHTVNRNNAGLLILPRNQPFMRNRSIDLLLNNIGCPILLMGKTEQ